jgi:hypothetical protein
MEQNMVSASETDQQKQAKRVETARLSGWIVVGFQPGSSLERARW